MSAQLIQAPDSKVWHVGVFVTAGKRLGNWLPVCDLNTADLRPWRWKASNMRPDLKWRTPHGICTNCARAVESAVRLIAAEESR